MIPTELLIEVVRLCKDDMQTLTCISSVSRLLHYVAHASLFETLRVTNSRMRCESLLNLWNHECCISVHVKALTFTLDVDIPDESWEDPDHLDTDEWFTDILTLRLFPLLNSQNLKHLSLTNWCILYPNLLSQHFSHVTTLSLQNMKFEPIEPVVLFIAAFPNLHSLEISNCKFICPKPIPAHIQNRINVTSLTLRIGPYIQRVVGVFGNSPSHVRRLTIAATDNCHTLATFVGHFHSCLDPFRESVEVLSIELPDLSCSLDDSKSNCLAI